MLDKHSLPQFSAGCDVRIPSLDTKAEDCVSRWSRTKLGKPAAIIVPSNEEDIVATIKYAAANELKVIPVDGAHGTFVPIDEHCIYLALSAFDRIDLDEEAGSVTFGGGVITRDVIRTLSEKGFYTCVPNSSAVGMAGFCLGGGSSPFNGLVGLAIDNILRIRIIMANGEDARLFNVLCGAGFGFGVVTSITLRAWRIRDLHMDEDKLWTRKLLFPPTAIQAAAMLLTKLQHPEPRLLVTLIFVRAPPTAPRPGAPMVMLSIGFLGCAAEGEKAAAASFDESVVSQTMVAESGTAALSSINDVSAPFDRQGDYKEQYSTWCSSLSVGTIVAAFSCWLRFGEETPEAKMTSFLVLAAKGTKGMLENDTEGKKFFPRSLRGRHIFVQAVPWWTVETAEGQARAWAAETMAIVNAPQHDGHAGESSLTDGDRVTAYAANLSKGIDLTTTWPASKIDEIEKLKGLWDSKGVFWNPVVDGV
ncbi:hypothetical protein LTR17_008798 [Elasticomyces elasticus]|nr:hypothetical protein LTR17_008798 [Elasticomyces elasticus]